MDHRLRRLSAILWMVGIIICLLVINSPLGRGYHRFPINILIICALTSFGGGVVCPLAPLQS